MESVIQESVLALRKGLIPPETVENWISFGDEYLENPQLHGTIPTKRNKNEPFYLAQEAGQAMFNLGIVNNEPITLYHGTYEEYKTGSLTSRIFSLSESIRVAEEFGDHLYEVNIPPGTPCFYVSSFNIYERSFKSKIERKQYLLYHSEEELIIPQGQLIITGSKRHREDLDDYVYNPIIVNYNRVIDL